MHASRRSRRSAVLVFFFFAVAALQIAAPSDAVITRADAEKHIRFLASDELMGRKTGTEGDHVAERYIAEHFRACGLAPAPGLTDYLQPVPLTRVHPAVRQELRIDGMSLKSGIDFIVLQGDDFEFSGEAKDVSKGPAGGEASQTPDLVRKVAVTHLSGLDPGAFEAIPQTAESLHKRGAAAVLELYGGEGWNEVGTFLAGPRLRLDESQPGSGIPYILVRDEGGALGAKLGRPGVHSVRIRLSGRRVERRVSANVVAVLPGRDPVLKEEFVGLTAHFDHLGEDPRLPGATKQDDIFNGARDNGMGVTAVLEAASFFSKNPPARSLLFIAFTGEEEGMLGSSYYVQNPAIPLQKTVFVLNTDGAGYDDTSVTTVLGLDRTTASKAIVEGCREEGLEAIPGGPDLQIFFNASDNRSFARKGVPSPDFCPGMRSFGPEIRKYYHQPSDQADQNFDFAYLQRFCKAYVRSVQLIADRPERPRWVAGDPFEKTAERLYGGK